MNSDSNSSSVEDVAFRPVTAVNPCLVSNMLMIASGNDESLTPEAGKVPPMPSRSSAPVRVPRIWMTAAKPAAAPGTALAASVNRSRSAVSAPTATASNCSASSRSEEHKSELQSLMRISYAVFCLKNKQHETKNQAHSTTDNIRHNQL